VTPSKRTARPGLTDTDRLLVRMKRLVQRAGDNGASEVSRHVPSGELDRLKSQLAESVRRDLADRDDGAETTWEMKR
jgi:hypothetical protein